MYNCRTALHHAVLYPSKSLTRPLLALPAGAAGDIAVERSLQVERREGEDPVKEGEKAAQ